MNKLYTLSVQFASFGTCNGSIDHFNFPKKTNFFSSPLKKKLFLCNLFGTRNVLQYPSLRDEEKTIHVVNNRHMECAENFNKRAAPDSLLRKESALAESDRRTCSRYIPQRKRARARLGNRGAMSRTGGRKPGPGPHTGDKHTHMAHTSARAFVSYHFGRSGVETRRTCRDETSDGQSSRVGQSNGQARVRIPKAGG